ncbi:MAG: hypothetical protein QM760_21615 [Nibricoccus sp.]
MRPLLSLLATILALAALPARAGIDEILAAIQRSDFDFTRNETDVPFAQTAWLQMVFHPDTELENGICFRENTLQQGALVPVYIGKRDMVLVGESFELSKIETTTGVSTTQSVVSAGPLAAWLRQYDENDLFGVFSAPFFSRELEYHDSWGTECFSGIVVMHWQEAHWTWLYGAIHEYSYGKNFFYPYVGAIWVPSKKWVVSMLVPWPTVYYAPRKGIMFSLGITPGGSSYQADDSGAKSTNSLNAWNVTASAGWRFYGRLWLVGGVGFSGLNRISVTTETDERIIKADPSPLATLSIQFRP